MRGLLFLRLLCCIGICCFACEAAGIMEALTTEKLTRASKMVILGEVEDLKSQWSETGEKIITRATVTITRVIRGKSASKQLIVEYDGGEVGGIGLKVSDVSPLRKREQVLLFLRPKDADDGPDVFNIVGRAQGKYTIHENGVARKSGFVVAGERSEIDNNIPLEALIQKIRAVATENLKE